MKTLMQQEKNAKKMIDKQRSINNPVLTGGKKQQQHGAVTFILLSTSFAVTYKQRPNTKIEKYAIA